MRSLFSFKEEIIMALKMYKYELISIDGTEKCNWSSWYYYSVGEIMSLSGRKYKVVKVL